MSYSSMNLLNSVDPVVNTLSLFDGRSRISNINDIINERALDLSQSLTQFTTSSIQTVKVDISGKIGDAFNIVNENVLYLDDQITNINWALVQLQGFANATDQNSPISINELNNQIATVAPLNNPSFTGTVSMNNNLIVQNSITAHNLRIADDLFLADAVGNVACSKLTSGSLNSGKFKLYEHTPSSSAQSRRGVIVHDRSIRRLFNTSESYLERGVEQ